MSVPLNVILDQLDERFDIDYDDYFKWSETSKNNLTNDLVTFMLFFVGKNHRQRIRLIIGIEKAVEHCESIEDFEQADILKRLHKALNELDWKEMNG